MAKKKKSEFGKISSTDVLNALYHACGASTLIVGIYIGTPTKGNLLNLVAGFVGGFLTSLFKAGATNSNGKVLNREVKEDVL